MNSDLDRGCCHKLEKRLNSNTYTDVDDKLVGSLFQDQQFASYWRCSEERIFKHIERAIVTYCPSHVNGTLLDAGCGDGRLSRRFHHLFGTLVLVDNDKTRLESAENLCRQLDILYKTKIMLCRIEDISNASIDVVICSHVLQHVNNISFNRIMKTFFNILKPNGLLFITSSHSVNKISYYIKTRYTDTGVASKKNNRT